MYRSNNLSPCSDRIARTTESGMPPPASWPETTQHDFAFVEWQLWCPVVILQYTYWLVTSPLPQTSYIESQLPQYWFIYEFHHSYVLSRQLDLHLVVLDLSMPSNQLMQLVRYVPLIFLRHVQDGTPGMTLTRTTPNMVYPFIHTANHPTASLTNGDLAKYAQSLICTNPNEIPSGTKGPQITNIAASDNADLRRMLSPAWRLLRTHRGNLQLIAKHLGFV